ncbi:uroporphyrinogen decarboxylase family protein [Mobiluncus mulieris]|uniref:Uroporphyrinogen decarboxylase n=1 Tax=Mobiluncus mulieris TaxID=2052 RepID=A0A378PC39_9ACTO|nr:uroporphyrinogen decarboxylase family protein [Mobiluncus mulieris]NMX04220.1 uroporphyrinogen decarboxylase [Mobiluncus mulieris]NMX10689.1 uroporphyrinogen decarboxylase [Mobiluncus mulieris]STY83710.1 Uroporphyrinogen decarboxylase [Mobiluncus mulieris]
MAANTVLLNTPMLSNSPFRAALAGVRPAQTPVWFMRQAGRSLPEYRAARAGVGMLTACTTPDLVAEITLQPVRRHDVDAAVFFSDIVIPLYLCGAGIDMVDGIGPVLDPPVCGVADVERLVGLEVSDWGVIEDAAALVRRELAFEKVLLGFAGAPFTLASYLIESGQPGVSKAQRRACLRTREFMRCQPEAWAKLATWCARLSGEFLAAQIRGGAEAVQLFDSWVGVLTESEYREYAQPYTRMALKAAKGVNHVNFAVAASHLLEALGETADVVSVGTDISLKAAAARLPGKVLQGNLNPELLVAATTGDSGMAPHEPESGTGGEGDGGTCGAPHGKTSSTSTIKMFSAKEKLWQDAEAVLEAGRAAPAHIFNLGHGVIPETDPGLLTELVARVHAWRPAGI